MATTPRFTGDAYWWSLQFQCLAAGTTSIWIQNDAEWGNGDSIFSFGAVSGATVQQIAQQTTTTRAVGGVVVPTNTYMTLAPYLAVIGLVATTAGVAIKKRRNWNESTIKRT